MPTRAAPSHRTAHSRRGQWTVVLMLAVGFAMLAALFYAPRGRPPAPPAVPVGVPDRPLRFVAYNVYHNYRGVGANVAQVRTLQPPPDVVMLEEVEPDQVVPMARAWGLPHVFHPRLPAAAANEKDWAGVCLLSRYPLVEGRPLRTADGATFGVWAYAVVDGRRFAVATVHLRATTGVSPAHVIDTNRIRGAQLDALVDVWHREGSPPLVVGGDFNQPAAGENYGRMTRHFTDALAALGKDSETFRWKFVKVRIDYLLVTNEWQPTDGGVIDGDASDHRPVWVQLTPATRPAPAGPGGGVPATRPESRPAASAPATPSPPGSAPSP